MIPRILHTLFKYPALVEGVDRENLFEICREPQIKALAGSLLETIEKYTELNPSVLKGALPVVNRKTWWYKYKEVYQNANEIDIINILNTELLDKENFFKVCETEYQKSVSLAASISLNQSVQRLQYLLDIKSTGKKADDDLFLEKFQDKYEKQIVEIYNNADKLLTRTKKKSLNMSEAISQYVKEMEKELSGGVKRRFYDKTFDDVVLWGAEEGEIGILAGGSSQGKSARMANLLNALVVNNVPTFIVSSEMGLKATFHRWQCIRNGISMKKIKKMLTSETKDSEDARVLTKMSEDLDILKNNTKHFRFSDKGDFTLKELEVEIKKFQNELKDDKYVFVIIDLLSMIKDFKQGSGALSLANRAEIAMDDLSAMAKRLGVHILGIVQLNRESDKIKVNSLEQIDKFRPTRNDIKNSAAYLERARYVILMFRRKYYAKTFFEKTDKEEIEKMDDIVELIFVKASNDELQTKKEILIPENFRYVPYEEPVVEGVYKEDIEYSEKDLPKTEIQVAF